MAEALFRLYLLAAPLVTLWGMWRGWHSDRPELVRSAGVVLAHFGLMQLAGLAWPPVAGQGHNFLFIALSLAVALRVICMVPATRANSILGGSVMGGILAALLYGGHLLVRGPSEQADWSLFFAQFTMAWANLIILLGWTHERFLGRVADRVFRRAADLVHAALARGVAR